MDDESRRTLIGGLWFFASIVLAALFISAAAQKELTTGHIVLAVAILGLVVAGTLSFLYGKGTARSVEGEKAKREQVDVESLLRSLSDEERAELKQRLEAGDLDEGAVLDHVDDDGEIVWRR